jgi:membrane protein implicated in regulation of membrane protease activity
MLHGEPTMFSEVHPILYREFVWFAIAAPVFGVACALLAKEWGRRQWVWFLLGFFFTSNAVLALIFLKAWSRRPDTDSKARK